MSLFWKDFLHIQACSFMLQFLKNAENIHDSTVSQEENQFLTTNTKHLHLKMTYKNKPSTSFIPAMKMFSRIVREALIIHKL